MKKRVIGLMLSTMAAMILAGCGTASKPEYTEIGPYFYEVGTYTSLDKEYAGDYFEMNDDNWGGGCSAISAVINGERLVGRNMDLNISNKCAYVVRTKIPGYYETFGLAYTFRDISPDYKLIQENVIDETFTKILPYMCDDVMNSEGLHIEIDMRHGEQDADGNDLFSVEHTNADAKERAYVFTLCQKIGLNCKDLADVDRFLANDIDVYSKRGYWNYCFLITDAQGNSKLLEFGNNKYYWVEPNNDGVVAQTNFYVNEELNKIEDVKTGLGRYATLMNGIGSVTNKHELFELMKKVQYSSYYLPFEECERDHFDPRSEVIGELDGADYAFVMDPENKEFIYETMDAVNELYRLASRQDRQDMNNWWESTFTEVVNPAERVIEVRLFENDESLYRVSFDGIEKIDEI